MSKHAEPRKNKTAVSVSRRPEWANYSPELQRLLDFLKHQRTVSATKTEVVFEGIFDLEVTSGIGAVIQIAFRILIKQVDGWWRDLVLNG